MNPGDVERFGLLEYVVPEKIDIGEYDSARFGVILQNGLIFLNKRDALEEQVKSLLHEILHMHPEFVDYTRGIWQGLTSRDEKCEARIEQLAERTYNERPDIVDFVKRNIKIACSLPLNRM